jgi:hypothetical protein
LKPRHALELALADLVQIVIDSGAGPAKVGKGSSPLTLGFLRAGLGGDPPLFRLVPQFGRDLALALRVPP